MEKFLLDNFFDIKEFTHSDIFKGCTYVWEALEKLKEFFKKVPNDLTLPSVSKGVILENPEKIFVGKGTIIEPGAYLRGPCYLGEECEVRSGAYLRGYVVCGNGCVIGHGTEIKSSICLDEVHASHMNYVGDSILGNRVNLGAGVKLANLRLDHQKISISFGREKIRTNLEKLGAIVGDDVQVGCNSVANPGTLIGKGTFCSPCVVLTGYIPPDSKVHSNQKMVVKHAHN